MACGGYPLSLEDTIVIELDGRRCSLKRFVDGDFALYNGKVLYYEEGNRTKEEKLAIEKKDALEVRESCLNLLEKGHVIINPIRLEEI